MTQAGLRPRATSPASPHLEAVSTWLASRALGQARPGDVYFHAAPAAFQAPGGGEMQLIQTGRHLEARGVRVRPLNPWTDRLEHARLLHLFGMSREGLALARVARERRVPVVLSPICWFEPRALAALATGPVRASWDLAVWLARRAARPRIGWRAELLALADRVLPNSQAEADQLVRLFGLDPRRVAVVPNGVETRFRQADPAPFRAEFGSQPFLLYVGRVEPRKNVLELVRAAGRVNRHLVVIGDPVPGHAAYQRACEEAGGRLVSWRPRMDHDDPRLASAYAAARVFALPSWFETPGLAALEAALAGSRLVVTPYGSTREYFGPHAEYARPGRPRELERALDHAWNRPVSSALAERVTECFTWPMVARRTAEAYDHVAA